jgi:hypothetical protein
MVGMFVTFDYPDGADRQRAQAVASNARKVFEGMPGLRSKAFTLDEAAGRATNFYVWESRDAAAGFFTDAVRQQVTELYGVEPVVTIVEILELVDNSVAVS